VIERNFTMNASPWILRPASERGHADFGWLDSRHTFSFGEYHDPRHMGFRSLRVINEDKVAGGGGFPNHPHRDMEIFSYVLEGELQHRDSLGNGRVLKPGEIQLMGAGRGVTHSEFNPSPTQATHFLQIWIQPRQRGLDPSYTEWKPTEASEAQAKALVISPDGRDHSSTIRQDAEVYRLRLKPGESMDHLLREGRGAWLQLMRGSLEVDGILLSAGDGASREETGNIRLTSKSGAEALLFDLA
jgi:redox-sensitive bicupin YhaK (pirin superfamily)